MCAYLSRCVNFHLSRFFAVKTLLNLIKPKRERRKPSGLTGTDIERLSTAVENSNANRDLISGLHRSLATGNAFHSLMINQNHANCTKTVQVIENRECIEQSRYGLMTRVDKAQGSPKFYSTAAPCFFVCSVALQSDNAGPKDSKLYKGPI